MLVSTYSSTDLSPEPPFSSDADMRIYPPELVNETVGEVVSGVTSGPEGSEPDEPYHARTHAKAAKGTMLFATFFAALNRAPTISREIGARIQLPFAGEETAP